MSAAHCASGEHDALLIADMPDSWSAVRAGSDGWRCDWIGETTVLKTTVLMSGSQGVEALKKADKVAKVYKSAK
jgi:hypothetical protein